MYMFSLFLFLARWLNEFALVFLHLTAVTPCKGQLILGNKWHFKFHAFRTLLCIAICFQSMSVPAKNVSKQFFTFFLDNCCDKVHALWLIDLYYCLDQTQKMIGCVTKQSQFCSANMDSFKVEKDCDSIKTFAFASRQFAIFQSVKANVINSYQIRI
jgi:hypothetical protein